jgi:hypothetical protein
MAKKKAAVKKRTEKAADIKPPDKTRATRRGCLEQDSPAYVVFSKYTKVKRDNGDKVVGFRATVINHPDISNFAFEVMLNGFYPYSLNCVPTNQSQSAEIECIFHEQAKVDHDGSGVGGPEDELVVTVIARKSLKAN